MTVRWRFPDPSNAAEEQQRAEIRAKIDAWWSALDAHRGELDLVFAGTGEWDLPAFMDAHLGAIDPQIMWEFGPAIRTDGHRLVITPESSRSLRPLVGEILSRAPTLPGWEWHGYRPAESVELARLIVEGRADTKLGDVAVRLTPDAFGRVDLEYVSPSGQRFSRQAAFVATETLLGEQKLDAWVGEISVGRPKKKWGLFRVPEELTPLGELEIAVEAHIARRTLALPDKPWVERMEHAQGSLLKLQPKEREDYPRQDDIFVAKTTDVDMWRAAREPQIVFASERFSRCGETYAYIKLDGRGGLDKEKFADKGEIEDAVDEVLLPEKLGCFIGGGTGLVYSYIDVALTDVPRAISAIRTRLREGNVPRRSWIQFYDSDLVAEWVGIWDDSPPPPMP